MHYFQRWAENDKARAAVSGTGRCLALLCTVPCILLWPAPAVRWPPPAAYCCCMAACCSLACSCGCIADAPGVAAR